MPGTSQAEEILKGEHHLRKMAERVDVNSKISVSFFLFVGDVNGTSSTAVSVKFVWRMNDGTYAISSLPIEKICVKLDEKAIEPSISIFSKKGVPQTSGNCSQISEAG